MAGELAVQFVSFRAVGRRCLFASIEPPDVAASTVYLDLGFPSS
jgi:hypothetical protein